MHPIKRIAQDEKGISLVELVTSIAIASVLLIGIFGIHVMLQNQFTTQSKAVKELNDLTVASKVITKDLRQADAFDLTNENSIKIKKYSNDEVHFLYDATNNVVYRNDVELTHGISHFKLYEHSPGKLELELGRANGDVIKTNIIIRSEANAN